MAASGRKTKGGANGGAPASDEQATSPVEQVRALYEQAESETAKALEEFVAKPSFGRLLATSGRAHRVDGRFGGAQRDLARPGEMARRAVRGLRGRYRGT